MAWTDRYVRDDAAGGGDGTTNTNSGANGAWTLAEAVANEAAGMRVNVRAGTYANTTTDRTLAAVGTTGSPIWWRGFNTAIGDLDTSHSLALPAITFTTGHMVVSGAYHYLSNLSLNGASVTGTNAGQLHISGGQCKVWRCRVENTGTNFSSYAVRCSSPAIVAGCWLKTTSNPDATLMSAASGNTFFGNVTRGGDVGVKVQNASHAIFNVIDDPTTYGIVCDTAGAVILGNSIYSPGSDGIRITATSQGILIANNILDSCGGYGISCSSGATGALWLVANRFRNNALGNLNNITEGAAVTADLLAALLNGSESSIPWVDAPNHDFDLLSTAASKGSGFPGVFENESAYAGYLDVGAVQHANPATGMHYRTGGG